MKISHIKRKLDNPDVESGPSIKKPQTTKASSVIISKALHKRFKGKSKAPITSHDIAVTKDLTYDYHCGKGLCTSN